MQCEACGDTISLSTAHRKDGQFVCPDCHADGQQQQAQTQQPAGEQRASSQQRTGRETNDGGAVTGSPTARLETPRARTNRSSNGASQGVSAGAPAEQKFNTLRRAGKFVAGCGWVLTALSVVCALLMIGAGEPSGMMEGMARVLGFFGSVLASMLGLLMVVAGQQTTCFVAIERNTRSTYELIRKQQA